MTQAPAANRSFIPEDFDPSDFANIEPIGIELLERRLGSLEELRQWIVDIVELFEHIGEYRSRTYIDKACHTDDAEIEKRFLDFVRNVQPKLQPVFFELQKRYLRNPQRHDLYEACYGMMELDWQADVDLYREDNIPLFTQEKEVINEYDKLCGAMTVEFQGETKTLQQMAPYLEGTDREVREQAWRLTADRRMVDREALDEIFEKLLGLRSQIAKNAELPTYRDYIWLEKKRFDYSPGDCEAFGDAIAKVCVPIVEDLDEQRKELLGVDSLRPWDTAVDPLGREPLQPFDAKDIDGFIEKARLNFECVSPILAEKFDTLRVNGNLDLESRLGKQPGGFQSTLPLSKQPFIFMNAAGTQRDVDTLLHEGGHAFHSIASFAQWNYFTQHAPLEFCEVASMCMELLCCDSYKVWYGDEANAARAKRFQLEGIIRFFPWMATIDGFQHWLYTNPGHTAEQRTEAWLGIQSRFGSSVIDWTGLENARASMWHRQLHLYHVPFYYIEYGIAQLGALQVWQNYHKDASKTLEQLDEAFALGGARPLPELFSTAGVRFAFDEETLGPLIKAIQTELATLPD